MVALLGAGLVILRLRKLELAGAAALLPLLGWELLLSLVAACLVLAVAVGALLAAVVRRRTGAVEVAEPLLACEERGLLVAELAFLAPVALAFLALAACLAGAD